MIFLAKYLCLPILLGYASNNRDKRLEIRVHSHYPCQKTAHSKWIEKLRFPSIRTTNLEPDPEHEGCYFLSGRVLVKQRIRGDVEVYVERRNKPSDEPIPCTGYESNGCGGQGSCLYCTNCENVMEHNAYKLSEPKIYVNRRPLDCNKGIRRTGNKNVSIHFCMPTKDEFFKANNLTEAIWNDIMNSGRRRRTNYSLHLALYIFDRNVHSLLSAQRKLAKFYRKNRLSANPTESEIKAYKKVSRVFNNYIEEEKGFIACHKLSGTLIVPR